MPTFPRTKAPRVYGMPKVPTGLRSRGGNGSIQFRSTTAQGRVWEETWGPLTVGNVDVEELLCAIEEGFNQGIIYDLTHAALPGSGRAPNGAGGGTPLIKGANQTGDTLTTDGWTPNITNVVRRGDFIKIVGLNTVKKILADASSDGSGNATIRVNAPIAVGGSPGDNAAITRAGVTLRSIILDYTVPDAPPGALMSGLRVTWGEVP
jgi:hypothetical protein